MQLQHHLAQVSDQLAAAAALGDDRTKEVAEALAAASASAVRLALLHAVTEAADEITAALLDYPGSPTVGVHLDGAEITLDVRPSQPADDAETPRREEGEPSARISLRLTEALKSDIDAAAERDGISVNTWLVRAATNALEPNPFTNFVGAFGPAGFAAGSRGRPRRDNNQRISGWING